MMSKLVVLIQSFLLFVIVASSFAGNYYIDPLNGSMNNDGSYAHPWSTLKAVMLSKPVADGDTLFLRNGFHGEGIVIGGVHATPVVIKAEEGHSPQLVNASISGRGWILEGLAFSPEGFSSTANVFLLQISDSAQDVVIQNCSFYSVFDTSDWILENWRSEIWDGVHVFGSDNTFRNNHFRNIRYAIQIEPEAHRTLVEYNTIESFCGDGIRLIGADSCIVQYNVIKNSVELDENPTVGNHEDGFQSWGGADDLLLRGNYILNFENPNQRLRGLLQGIGCFDGPYFNWIVENNVVIVEHWHGISLYEAHNCRIVNNTVLPVPGYSQAGPPWIGVFPHKNGTPGSSNLVRNNLTTNINLEPGTTEDHNFLGLIGISYVNDYENMDFRPKPGMPPYNGRTVIDGGSPDGAPTVDINGVARPWGNGYDIGAYEYDGSYGQGTGVDSPATAESPQAFVLEQNYPNPFNPRTTIGYRLSQACDVELTVHNALGQLVQILVHEKQAPGAYNVKFGGSSFAGGVYFYRLEVNGQVQVHKMILNK